MRRIVLRPPRWEKDAAQLPVTAQEPSPTFVPLAFAAAPTSTADIRIELRGRAVSATISWPLSAAEACAVWLRAVLR